MKLIISADDLGISRSVNKGIIELINNKVITNIGIMMNMEYTNHAINLIKENKINCVGIHLNLTKGRPTMSGVRKLVGSNGEFNSIEEVLKYTDIHVNDIKRELENQIIKFKKNKLIPTHLDYHKNLHENPYILNILFDLAKRHSLPLRVTNDHVKKLTSYKNIKCNDLIYFLSDFNSVEEVKSFIELNKDKNEVIEIICHPGYIDEYTKSVTSMLTREEELNFLIECKENNVFEGVDLISYKGI